MSNLFIKREHMTAENKRLLEKSEKIKTRIEALVAQGAEQQEIDYERSTINVEETNKLNSFTEHSKRYHKNHQISFNSTFENRKKTQNSLKILCIKQMNIHDSNIF